MMQCTFPPSFSSAELATHAHPEAYDLVRSCLSKAAGEIQTNKSAMNTNPSSYWQFDPTPYDDAVLDFGQPHQILLANSEQPNGEDSAPKPFARKAFHNARERHRRKKLNVLYSDLRSLLPKTNSKRKLSIPKTVSRVLRYIPELRNEIQQLAKQRDQLVSSMKASSEVSKSASVEQADVMEPHPAPGSCDPPVVKVHAPLGHSELIITVSTSKDGIQLSAILFALEGEGLELLNSSTFISENKVHHHLHLQITSQKTEFDTNLLQNKLSMLCEKSLPALRVHQFCNRAN